MYVVGDYSSLKGIDGLSDELLNLHFGLYKGYVSHVNKLLDRLEELLEKNQADVQEFDELKRRFGWEFNGMRLHELYFENLKKGGLEHDISSDLHAHLASQFGSHEIWEKDFRAMGGMRGIGWAVLYYDVRQDKLLNVWIDQHDKGNPAGCVPILVMDLFEHAYMLDYKTDKSAYIDAFFKNIDWKTVEERFKVQE